jgi:hypothetical protein
MEVGVLFLKKGAPEERSDLRVKSGKMKSLGKFRAIYDKETIRYSHASCYLYIVHLHRTLDLNVIADLLPVAIRMKRNPQRDIVTRTPFKRYCEGQ